MRWGVRLRLKDGSELVHDVGRSWAIADYFIQLIPLLQVAKNSLVDGVVSARIVRIR